MPRRPKQVCAWPGCGELVEGTYCALHRRRKQRAAKRRPSAAKRGYGRDWRRYRIWFLRRHPLCQTPGCREPATDVDHIQAVSGPDDPRFWDQANHQALCHRCHSRKTAALDGAFGRRPDSELRPPGGRGG